MQPVSELRTKKLNAAQEPGQPTSPNFHLLTTNSSTGYEPQQVYLSFSFLHQRTDEDAPKIVYVAAKRRTENSTVNTCYQYIPVPHATPGDSRNRYVTGTWQTLKIDTTTNRRPLLTAAPQVVSYKLGVCVMEGSADTAICCLAGDAPQVLRM